MNRADLFKHAYAMAYVTLLSLIPSLAAIFALFSLFTPALGSNGELISQLKDFVLQNLAAGSGENAVKFIDSTLANLDVGKIGATGLAGMLFTLILLLRQIEIALNRIFQVQRERNFFSRIISFWTYLTLGGFIASVVVGATSGYKLASFSEAADPIAQSPIANFMVSFAGMVVAFTLVYKLIPNRTVPMKQAFFGAIPAAILLKSSGFVFAIYTKFSSYQALYGALAAIPLFLFWLYMIWVIVLFGAVFAWRAGQGFTKQSTTETQEELTNSLAELRNHEILAILPILILAFIHKKFLSGDRRGAACQDLYRELDLPEAWVDRAVECLVDLRYIQISTPTDSVDPSYFPTCPAKNINLQEVRQKLTQDALDWLKLWEPPGSSKLPRLALELLSETTPAPETTLDELISDHA